MNSLDSADARAAVRAARSAPTSALEDLAARCGGLRVMLAHLASARRGGCGDATNAEAAARRPLLLGHPATPPAAVRAAGADLPRRSRDAATGSASWATRTISHSGAHRRRIAMCAALDDEMQPSAATRWGCPRAVLDRLASHPEREVRLAAAGSPWCPTRVLVRLRSHPDARTAAAALINPAMPTTHLVRAVDERRHPMRHVVAATANPNCPQPLLLQLARDDNPAVRATVAANHACPSHVVASLAGDREMEVRRHAVGNASCTARMLQDFAAASGEDPALLAALAENPACGADLLRSLAGHSDETVRCAAAEHRSCPTDALAALAAGSSVAAAAAAAENPNCPAGIIAALAHGGSHVAIRAAAASNPNCDLELLRSLATSSEILIRWAAAENPACPSDILEALAEDPELTVRRTVAAHPGTRPSTLEQLTADSEDPFIRACALGWLRVLHDR